MRDSTFSTFLGKSCISSCHTLEPPGVDVVRCGAPLRPRVPAPPAPILAIARRTNSPLLFYHSKTTARRFVHNVLLRALQRKPNHNSSSLSASAATADTKSFPPAQLTFVKPGDISASNGIIPCEICEIECPQTFGVSAASLSKFRRIIPQILCAFSLWGQAQHNWGHYRLDLKYTFVTLAIWILDVFE